MDLHRPLEFKEFENYDELAQIGNQIDEEKKEENIEMTDQEIESLLSILNSKEI